MDRYRVVPTSVSAHCCFEATVEDTRIEEGSGYFKNVCECFDLEDARRICAALNALDKQS